MSLNIPETNASLYDVLLNDDDPLFQSLLDDAPESQSDILDQRVTDATKKFTTLNPPCSSVLFQLQSICESAYNQSSPVNAMSSSVASVSVPFFSNPNAIIPAVYLPPDSMTPLMLEHSIPASVTTFSSFSDLPSHLVINEIKGAALEYLISPSTKGKSLQEVCQYISLEVFKKKSIDLKPNCFEKFFEELLHSYYLSVDPKSFPNSYPNAYRMHLKAAISSLKDREHIFLVNNNAILYPTDKKSLEGREIWNSHTQHLLFFFYFLYFHPSLGSDSSRIDYISEQLSLQGFNYQRKQITSEIQTLKKRYERNPSKFFETYKHVHKSLLHFFIDISQNRLAPKDNIYFSVFSSSHLLQKKSITPASWDAKELFHLLSMDDSGASIGDIVPALPYKTTCSVKRKRMLLKKCLCSDPTKYWRLANKSKAIHPLLEKFAAKYKSK